MSKPPLATRYTHAYDCISNRINDLQKGLNDSAQYRKELNEREEETGRRCSDSESQQISLERAWDEVARVEMANLKSILMERPSDLITRLRKRIAYWKKELRELNREEPEGPWAAASAAGTSQAIEECIMTLQTAIAV